MNDFFEDEEKLYRAVVPNEMFIKADGTVTSAAFKSSDGCSVDRGKNRSDEDAVSFMKKTLQGSIYSLLAKSCREKDIYINYEPTEENPFHSALYRNSMHERMTSGQCKHLARCVVFVSV